MQKKIFYYWNKFKNNESAHLWIFNVQVGNHLKGKFIISKPHTALKAKIEPAAPIHSFVCFILSFSLISMTFLFNLCHEFNKSFQKESNSNLPSLF